MNGDSLTKRKTFRVRLAGSQEARTVIRTGQRQDMSGEEEVIELVACPCGKVIHDIREAAAFCTVGSEPLCFECSLPRCHHCKKAVCVDHRTLTLTGKTACIAHSTLRLLFS